MLKHPYQIEGKIRGVVVTVAGCEQGHFTLSPISCFDVLGGARFVVTQLLSEGWVMVGRQFGIRVYLERFLQDSPQRCRSIGCINHIDNDWKTGQTAHLIRVGEHAITKASA